MKKTTHRILAAILAACLLFSGAIGASAAASKFGATITISKMPTDPTFVPGIIEPDLAGLELAFKLGGVEKTLRYDDINSWYDDLYDVWDFDFDAYYRMIEAREADSYNIWLADPDGRAKIGANTFYLEVSVRAGDESYTNARIPIALTGVPLLEKVGPSQIAALRPGLPTMVDASSLYDNSSNITLYSFTPRVTGWYSFRSSLSGNSRLANALYRIAPYPFYLFLDSSDPYGKLFDAEGTLVAESDDRYFLNYSSLDFSVRALLTAGQTYYLLPSTFYSYSTARYAVTPIFLAPVFAKG
ncbi:MAG: hypothetical protein FWE98_06205 [Oscillospiraceae bacterium]|nr:hypothetical protein [Oscillospiraceae bacterium]